MYLLWRNVKGRGINLRAIIFALLIRIDEWGHRSYKRSPVDKLTVLLSLNFSRIWASSVHVYHKWEKFVGRSCILIKPNDVIWKTSAFRHAGPPLDPVLIIMLSETDSDLENVEIHSSVASDGTSIAVPLSLECSKGDEVSLVTLRSFLYLTGTQWFRSCSSLVNKDVVIDSSGCRAKHVLKCDFLYCWSQQAVKLSWVLSPHLTQPGT